MMPDGVERTRAKAQEDRLKGEVADGELQKVFE